MSRVSSQKSATSPIEDRAKMGLSSPEVISRLTDPAQNASVQSRLIPLVDWPKYHPWPPLGGLRHMVFHGDKTGFSRVTIKVGRRRLIDEKKFFEFVKEQNSKELVE